MYLHSELESSGNFSTSLWLPLPGGGGVLKSYGLNCSMCFCV